jgi:hypothetical protein
LEEIKNLWHLIENFWNKIKNNPITSFILFVLSIIFAFFIEKTLNKEDKASFEVKIISKNNFDDTKFSINNKDCKNKGNDNKIFSCDYLPASNYGYIFEADGKKYEKELEIIDKENIYKLDLIENNRLNDVEYKNDNKNFFGNLTFTTLDKSDTQIFKINGSTINCNIDNKNKSKIYFEIPLRDYFVMTNPLVGFLLNIQLGEKVFTTSKIHLFDKSLFSNYDYKFIEIKEPNELKIINYDKLSKFENIKLLNSGENNPKEFFIKFDINNINKNTVLNFYQGKKIIWRFENSKYKVDISDFKKNDKYIFGGKNKPEYFMQSDINPNGNKGIKEKISFSTIFERKLISDNKYECSINFQPNLYSRFEEKFDCDEINTKTDFYLNIEKTKVKLKQEVFSISNLKTGEKKENHPDFEMLKN